MAKLGKTVVPLAAIVVLLLASACDTECQEFCTTWFDYQQDICGEIDTEDARILCIADYRGHLVAAEERDACQDLVAEVEALRSSTDRQQQESCCAGNSCQLSWQPGS